MRRRGDAAAVLLGLSVLAGAGAAARTGRVGSAEAALFARINRLPDRFEGAMDAVQFLGTLGVSPVVAVIALLRGRHRLAGAVVATTGLKLVSERLVRRLLVQRGRPGSTIRGAIVRRRERATGLGFVSGHVALATGLAWTMGPYQDIGWRRVTWAAVALVALSRIYLGAHSPLDVVGGAGLGLACGGLADLAVGVDPASGWASTSPSAGAHGFLLALGGVGRAADAGVDLHPPGKVVPRRR